MAFTASGIVKDRRLWLDREIRSPLLVNVQAANFNCLTMHRRNLPPALLWRSRSSAYIYKVASEWLCGASSWFFQWRNSLADAACIGIPKQERGALERGEGTPIHNGGVKLCWEGCLDDRKGEQVQAGGKREVERVTCREGKRRVTHS